MSVKCKWILLLAVMPLVCGLVFGKRLAGKRPQLVARDVDANVGLIFSADEKRLLAVRDESDSGSVDVKIATLDGMDRFEVISDSIDPFLFFSPNGKWIYQLDLDSYYGSTNDMGIDYRRPRPDEKIGVVGRDALHNKGSATIRFTFPGVTEDFYGAWLSAEHIVVESRQKTWHLDANNLQILNTQPQKRKLTSVDLCPDGKTVYRRVYGRADFCEFFDLQTGESLWKLPDNELGFPRFSKDGSLFIRMEKGEVIARDTRTGAEQWRFRGPTNRRIWLAPDHSAIYEVRENGELWKWPR